MKQVFAKEPVTMNQPFFLDEKQAHHLFDVLRTTPKETVRVIWNNEVFLAHPDQKPSLFIFGKEEVEPRKVDITLCPALIKADKFEWMLQKATELGVSRIVPFQSRNSVVQIEPGAKMDKKMKRWTSILEAAAKQSNRNEYVMLEPIQNIDSLKDYKSDTSLVAYEGESDSHLADHLKENPQSITIVIGPEGGFTPEEIEILKANGFETASLGEQILRAETAALYCLSAIDYQSHIKRKPDIPEL